MHTQKMMPEGGDRLAMDGMMDLAMWCIDYAQLIVQGRESGTFRMAVSPGVKELIRTVCPDTTKAIAINASLLDVAA